MHVDKNRYKNTITYINGHRDDSETKLNFNYIRVNYVLPCLYLLDNIYKTLSSILLNILNFYTLTPVLS